MHTVPDGHHKKRPTATLRNTLPPTEFTAVGTNHLTHYKTTIRRRDGDQMRETKGRVVRKCSQRCGM